MNIWRVQVHHPDDTITSSPPLSATEALDMADGFVVKGDESEEAMLATTVFCNAEAEQNLRQQGSLELTCYEGTRILVLPW